MLVSASVARRVLPLLALAATAAALGLLRSREAPASSVVLLSVDTLRADALLGERGEHTLMPRLLRRAMTEGQLFRNAYATSTWTLPSHVSMLSGRYPASHGANDLLAADIAGGGHLPSVLERYGVATLGIVGGGFVSAAFGLDSGFREWHEVPIGRSDLDWFATEALAAMERVKGERFLLFLHTYFVHDYYKDAQADGLS